MSNGKDKMRGAEAWRLRATAWELAALSFRYPDAVLADAVASGEWREAAEEIAAELGVELPAGWDEGLTEAAGAAACGVAGAAGGAAGGGDLGGVASGAVDADALLHALRAEATRLFVGAPDPVVSPYEGVHRAAADGVQPLLFVNPHSMDVERFMRACGLGRPEGTNEPLDHVATECELMEVLSLRAAAEAEGSDEADVPDGAEGLLLDGGEVASEGRAPDAAGAVSADASTCSIPPADLPGGSAVAAYETFLADHVRVWVPGFAEAVAGEARHPFYRAAAFYLGALVERA